MNLSPARHRAAEFARLVDGGARTDDPTLAPLVAVAEALRQVPAGPDPAFRDALRQRLVAVAAVQTAPEPPAAAGERVRAWAGSWRVQRRLAAGLAGVAAVVVVGGVGLGASRSLPGQPLYGVKRAAEAVQLATASGDYAKGRRHLEFARTRMAEVDALVGQAAALSPGLPSSRPMAAGVRLGAASTSMVIDTLRDMNANTVTGANDLSRAYADGQDAARTALSTFAQAQRQDLVAVLPALPTPARAVAAISLALLGEVDHQVQVLSTARCGHGVCTGATPGAAGGAGSPAGGGSGATPGPGAGGSSPGSAPAGGGTVTTTPSTGTGLPGTSPSSGGSTPSLPGTSVTTTTPLPTATLVPLPLPTVTLPSTLSTPLTTLVSPSPTPSPTTSTSLLPLPLPSLG